MHLSTLVGWQLARTVAVICSGLLAGMMVPCTAAALTNTPPTITRQPVGNIAGVGESYVFTVVATGTTPFTYQWQFNGLALGGATDSRLVLTNLMVAQSGNYSVIVSNIAGRMISSNAVLAVETNVTRRLGTGRILQFGSLVGVPILLRANGQEHAVSFSLGYDTNAYSNPTFVTRYTNATVDLNLTQPGVAGLAMTLPAAETFQAGYRILGLMRFQLAPGSNNLQGGLVFTTNPVPIAAVNSTAEVLQISASILLDQFL